MAQYRRELPGDLLNELLNQNQVSSVADFTRQHERRVGRELERHLDKMALDQEEDLFDRLALRYDQWTNRFAIRWDPKTSPKQWRALFTIGNLDALLFAKWFEEGSELHIRFRQALDLQDVLHLRGTYDGAEHELAFEEETDFRQVFDRLCWSYSDFIRQHPQTRNWSFVEMGQFVRAFASDTLPALASIGVITLPDDWANQLIDLDRTRAGSPSNLGEDDALLDRISAWADLILADVLPENDESGQQPSV